VWYLDNAATCHLTNSLDLLFDVEPTDSEIESSTGTSERAHFKGKALIHDLSQPDPIVLTEVYYCPTAPANLISLIRIRRLGLRYHADEHHTTITDNGTPVVRAQHDKLGMAYVPAIGIKEHQEQALKVFYTQPKETPQLWHARLGHLGTDNLSKLVDKHMVTGINLKVQDIKSHSTTPCDSCAVGKSTRLPFRDSDTEYITPLELVSTDVCGPMEKPTPSGARFFLTVIDHATDLSVVVLMKRKAEVPTTPEDHLCPAGNSFRSEGQGCAH